MRCRSDNVTHSFIVCTFPYYHDSVAVLTQENGIAATMAGSGCHPEFNIYDVQNCTVVVAESGDANVTQTEQCSVLFAKDVPGSNLYFFSWFALMASVNITLRWKAAQALQFAQAAQVRVTNTTDLPDDNSDDAADDDEDAI